MINASIANAIERLIELVEFEDNDYVTTEDADGGVVVLNTELSEAISHLANLYWNEDNPDDTWYELIQQPE